MLCFGWGAVSVFAGAVTPVGGWVSAGARAAGPGVCGFVQGCAVLQSSPALLVLLQFPHPAASSGDVIRPP